ncbi:MAG TPA: recombinase family protein [Terriglobia bacterium]|nr:recombinase family protein [Terriglobia bacterium]
MAKVERIRELMRDVVGPDYFREKTEAGWKLVAVEWQREIESGPEEPRAFIEDVPFGLRVSADCQHLEENPSEKETLVTMMDLIVQDNPLSKVAEEMNQRGFRTRQGGRWAPVTVFNMLPRLIEVGPRIFSSEEWSERRHRLLKVV